MTLPVGFTHQIITLSLERSVYLAGFGQNRLAQSVQASIVTNTLALILLTGGFLNV